MTSVGIRPQDEHVINISDNHPILSKVPTDLCGRVLFVIRCAVGAILPFAGVVSFAVAIYEYVVQQFLAAGFLTALGLALCAGGVVVIEAFIQLVRSASFKKIENNFKNHNVELNDTVEEIKEIAEGLIKTEIDIETTERKLEKQVIELNVSISRKEAQSKVDQAKIELLTQQLEKISTLYKVLCSILEDFNQQSTKEKETNKLLNSEITKIESDQRSFVDLEKEFSNENRSIEKINEIYSQLILKDSRSLNELIQLKKVAETRCVHLEKELALLKSSTTKLDEVDDNLKDTAQSNLDTTEVIGDIIHENTLLLQALMEAQENKDKIDK